MDFDGMHYVAVVLAAVAGVIIGGIWYTPQVFGTAWMKAAGMTQEKLKTAMKGRNTVTTYVFAFISALLIAFVLGCQIEIWQKMMGGGHWLMAAKGAFWNWLGFIVPVVACPVLWEGKSTNYLLINAAYYFVTLQVMAFILVQLSPAVSAMR